MIVICAGMLRSGSTWQYQVACELAERSGRAFRPLGFLAERSLVEFITDQHDSNVTYIYKTHHPEPVYGQVKLNSPEFCVLYSFRDLRDVVYSMMHKLGGISFETAVRERKIIDVCIEADHYWRSVPAEVVQPYERWLKNNEPSVGLIARAMGMEFTDSVYREVAKKFVLEENRGRTAKLADQLTKEGVDLKDQANALKYDAKSLLHWNHLRTGEVGGWRMVATPAEIKLMDEKLGDWLIANGYEKDHSWSKLPLAKAA